MSVNSAPCPKCRSADVVSNSCLGHASAHSAVHGAVHFGHHYPLVAVALGGYLLAARAVDAVRHKLRCAACGHLWS